MEKGEVIKFGSLTRDAGCKRGRPFFKITCLTMTMSTGQIEGGGPRSQCSEFSGVNLVGEVSWGTV